MTSEHDHNYNLVVAVLRVPYIDDKVTLFTGFKAGRKRERLNAGDACSCALLSRVQFSFGSGSRLAKYRDSLSSEANELLF